MDWEREASQYCTEALSRLSEGNEESQVSNFEKDSRQGSTIEAAREVRRLRDYL